MTVQELLKQLEEEKQLLFYRESRCMSQQLKCDPFNQDEESERDNLRKESRKLRERGRELEIAINIIKERVS